MRILKIALIVLGITSVVSQLVLIREFLAIFGGNELIFGIILGNWTLLTGIGSYVGKNLPPSPRLIALLHLGMGTLPLLLILILRISRNILFTPGEIVHLIELFTWSLVLMLPLCLITGSYLTVACSLYSKDHPASDIGSVYIVDSMGDITGGALFSFFLIYVLNQVQITYLLYVVNFVLGLSVCLFISDSSLRGFLLLRSSGTKIGVVALIGLCIFGVIISAVDLHEQSLATLYENQHIIHEKNSLYGHIVVTEAADQITVFENNIPFFSTQDVMAIEETIHYAMVQLEKEDIRVLLIGGGVSGTLKEIRKYPVSVVDYVEIDPDIIAIGGRYSDLGGASIHTMDGRQYVKTTSSVYDVVILDVPDPDSVQLNRFYTVEFFEEVKNILSDHGIFSLSVSSSPHYLGKPSRLLNSTLYKSLKLHFSQVMLIPGTDTYFLASDAQLTQSISEKIEQKSIPTDFVQYYYLSGLLTEDRFNMIENSTSEEVNINADFHPQAYYYYLAHWTSQFHTSFLVFLGVIAFCVVVFFSSISLHPLPFAIFTTGFTGAALEIVLVLGFQVVYGYVYSQVGILITVFMIGLLIGATVISKKKSSHSFRVLLYIECSFILCSGLLIFVLPSLTHICFLIFVIVVGILVGAEFPLASLLYYSDLQTTAATLFSADLLGACLGAFLVSTLLIPLLGVLTTCVAIAGLNIVSLIVLLTMRR
jgi:spermidine synthase